MSTVGNTSDAAATSAAPSARAAAGRPGASEAEDRFLKLLVAQLKNQDPLNPMDNAQITSQMAQISTVSGIDKLNTTLQSMAASFSADQSLQATAMIGRSVLAPGSGLELQNGTAAGGVELPRAADQVALSIRDGSGQGVHEVDLGPQPAGVLGFQWDGVTDSGASAVPGSYSFAVEAVQGGKKIVATALALGLVSGVTQGKDGVALKVNGMGSVALSDVKQVM
ncbi:MAG: flagellar hook assembly protein FlgD [Betaproteobacteria bacterium]|nr:flagellar hook assembly protein FlgD [Betaproteobacteria bacterium]